MDREEREGRDTYAAAARTPRPRARALCASFAHLRSHSSVVAAHALSVDSPDRAGFTPRAKYVAHPAAENVLNSP